MDIAFEVERPLFLSCEYASWYTLNRCINSVVKELLFTSSDKVVNQPKALPLDKYILKY